MKMSENIGELVKALCSAQSEFKHAFKGSANPFYKSKYADYQEVVDAVRAPLNKNGIAYFHTTSVAPGEGVIVETTIAHTTGQWVSMELLIVPDKRGPQSTVAAVTYGKRCGLEAITGLVASEDDDGETVSGRGPAAAEKAPSKREILKKLDEAAAKPHLKNILAKYRDALIEANAWDEAVAYAKRIAQERGWSTEVQ